MIVRTTDITLCLLSIAGFWCICAPYITKM